MSLYHLGSIQYHSEPSGVPYFSNQFLALFAVSYTKMALIRKLYSKPISCHHFAIKPNKYTYLVPRLKRAELRHGQYGWTICLNCGFSSASLRHESNVWQKIWSRPPCTECLVTAWAKGIPNVLETRIWRSKRPVLPAV